MSLTNRRFEIPEDFDFEAFTPTAFDMICGETLELRIRFSASQVPRSLSAFGIRERRLTPSRTGVSS